MSDTMITLTTAIAVVGPAFSALGLAVGVQYWENRKKDKDARDDREREFALREKELLAKTEQTKALQDVAGAIRDCTQATKDQGGRIEALRGVQETTTKSLIDTLAKRTISSTTTQAVGRGGE
jgi:Flp pilus assembly protein TadB